MTVPVVPNYYCKGKIRPCHLCAGTFRKDGCSSDSGSPLFCYNNKFERILEVDDSLRNRFVVHGIFNSGVCGEHPNVPGVYARVSYYRDWIDENLARYSYNNLGSFTPT